MIRATGKSFGAEPEKPKAIITDPRVIKSDWDQMMEAAEMGMTGKNPNIPIGFPRLNNHLSIRPKLYVLLGGYTGSGKTSFVDDAFVLNPIDYLATHPENLTKLHVNYWSMERSKLFKLTKWLLRKIFLDMGKVISVERFFGWWGKDNALTMDEKNLIDEYEWYLEMLQDFVTIIERPQNPMGVKKFIDAYALREGKLHHVSEYERVYEPNEPNKITINLFDHIGKWRKETRDKIVYRTKKELIDLASDDQSYFRDMYGHTIIAISQFNRDISSPIRIKNGDVEPQLEDFKESGNTQEDADVVLTLFDVMRYKVPDPSGYDLDELRNKETGAKKYRNLKIAKNSFGSDDIRIGLAFQPEVGHFKEMPKLNRIVERDYQDIISDEYFLR